jgi:mRNA-degrading endonuclease RelE of RelBE toxin-antitoxin system
MTNEPVIRIEFTPYFEKEVKQLRKKYPRVAADLKSLTDRLGNGETPGNQVQGVGYSAYKVRLRNSDVTRGKSGGYRVIYYIRTRSRIVLLTIYSKSEQVDISSDEIKRLIDEYRVDED